jgi:hypothetical protein
MNTPFVLSRCVSLGLPLLLVACASAGGVRLESLDSGVLREFDSEYAIVLTAARNAVTGVGFTIDSDQEVDDSTAVIVARKGISGWSWGELVRIAVQQSADQRVAVRVLTRRRLATNLTAKGDWSDVIFSHMDAALR